MEKSSGNITYYFLLILVLIPSSCIFKAKKKCPQSELLADTLLFKNPSQELIIDKSWCVVWQDYAYFIKGRIQNEDSIKRNLNMLGIVSDTTKNSLTRLPFQEKKIIDWFNVERLNKDKEYLKYSWKFKNTATYKWIYYKDVAVCDTFYIALINT